jgi:drug/metabolite transporter (DMT)-like permease
MPRDPERLEMTTADRVRAIAPRNVMIAAAFAAIYLIWGSTYLAIKYAIETVPPFLMTGARFLIAGGVLYAWSVFRPAPASATNPGVARTWRDAFIVGALLIVGGTALVGWAELSVPSGITSLILATTPLWMVLLESIGARRAPAPRVIAGVAVGLAGLAILIWPSLTSPGSGVHLLGVAALALAALTWSAGALYSRRAALPASATRATGMQMLAGAVLSIVVGLSLGEHEALSPAAITPASLVAIGYLVVAGALVGFSAYLWLMRVSTPSRVATHAYVNPVVAVLLGWAVLGESFTTRTAVAMAVIVVAVVLIVSAPASPRAAAGESTAPNRARRTRKLAERAA